jgi:hypothetical protein
MIQTPRVHKMTDDHKKRMIFYIDAYSPETIPMAKLAEYMTDFAELLGKEHAVHFEAVEPGSTQIVSRVEFEDVPKVRARLTEMHNGAAPKELVRLMAQIDHRLANDNATGRILFVENERAGTAFPQSPVAVSVAAAVELLAFPGRDRPKIPSYGPFTQEGHLDGVLIALGGKDETISIRLQNGEITYSHCDTTRTIARELAKHMFEPVRIHGTGRWVREADGAWTLIRFRIHRFEPLSGDSLRETVAALRAVPGSEWNDFKDPLAELDDLRRDKDELH